MLKPQDVATALKLALSPEQPLGYEQLAKDLSIGLSTAHRSATRLMDAGLVTTERKVNRKALLEFVIHGVRYAYFVKPGEMTRGVPTAHSAPPLSKLIRQGSDAYVWPDPLGKVRGQAVTPLCKTAPKIAQHDLELYELLALIDAIRIGRARERKLAEDELRQRLA